MVTAFDFDDYFYRSEKGKNELLFIVFSAQIGINAQNVKPIENEAHAGALFAQIMAHDRLSIVVPDDDPHVVHTFHVLPLDRPAFDIIIKLNRATGRGGQVVATLNLSKVQLLGFPANKEESYTANLKVTGSAGASYPSEAED
jgi:hypothetical protein